MRSPPLAMLAVLIATTGCAVVQVRGARPDEAPRGIRVYPPRVYLLVDASAASSELVTLPDLCRPYDVRPRTFFARHDFKLDVDQGQVAALASEQDTNSLLALFGRSAELAAKATGAGVSSRKLAGSFGLESGIYQLRDAGDFERLRPGAPPVCAGWED